MGDVSLSGFIQSEMQKRNMSARQFAQFIGVSHGTINRFLDFGTKDVGYPSVDFMFKLAKATETDVGTLMAMIEPNPAPIDPETLAVAQQFQQLSEAERKLIFAAIRGLLAEREK